MEKDEHFLKQHRNKQCRLQELVIASPLVFYCDENSLLASEKVRRFDLLLISPGKFSIIMKRRCKWMDGWRGVWSVTTGEACVAMQIRGNQTLCRAAPFFRPIKEPILPERPELNYRLKKQQQLFLYPGKQRERSGHHWQQQHHHVDVSSIIGI